MQLLRLVYRYTLNNVIFGIALLVAVTLYIAIGSGFPSIRAYFDLNDLEFFNAWPLKVLMLLMCLTLAVVTWNRIPLTPPRYGVWCIHCGIVTLIVGMSLYYHLKVEGKTLIPVGRSVNYFYDSAERALYVRLLNRPVYGMHDLPSLPRFASYDAQGGTPMPQRSDLTNIEHFLSVGPEETDGEDLAHWLGVPGPVRMDIVGYYPYADVQQDVVEDPASNDAGVELKVASPHADTPESTIVLTAADPTAARQMIGATELEHRDVSQSALEMVRQSADRMLRMTITLPKEPQQTLNAQIGKTYELGGYRLTVDSFNPAFPMFGTHEIVKAMTVHVISNVGGAKKEFWRMILENRLLQTDFKMDPATTPPMVKGNRQKEPLDKELVLGFAFDDPAGLMPTNGGQEKHTFLTSGDSTLVDVFASVNAGTQVKDFSANGGSIPLSFDGVAASAQVQRANHFRIVSRVAPTPPIRWVKDDAEAGIKQVVTVRVTAGDFSQTIDVPCDLYPLPDAMLMEPMEPWQMGVVKIPGASSPIQLQLGFACRPMPAALTLRKFELVHYPGGQGEMGPFRDFRSTLEINPPSGERDVEVASLNSPIYFDGGKWIFFQAGYDPDGQSSTIGVGNRPGVVVMITGCVMIVLGLMYAFYIKPMVIRRMKAAALAKRKPAATSGAATAAMPNLS